MKSKLVATVGAIRQIPKDQWIIFTFIVIELILIDGGVTLTHHRSTLSELHAMVVSPGQDSWKPMQLAYRWIVTRHSDSLYQAIFFTQHNKFQYPPSSLLLYVLTDQLHAPVSFGMFGVLNVLSLLFFAMQSLACAGIAVEMARKLNFRSGNRSALWGLALLAVLTSLLFYPAGRAGGLGQIQTWLNSWFVLACYCWLKDERLFAGLLVGAICVFKPQFGLFLIWGILRKQWRFLAGWVLVVLPAELTSLLMFGLANNVAYISILRFLSRHGESFAANQSVNGLLNRLLGDGFGVATWESHAFPPYRPVVYLLTVSTSLAFVFFSLFGYAKRKPVNIIDFLIAGLSFTLASPIAWEHHYGFLPAAFVTVGVRIMTLASSRERRHWALVLAVLFTFAGHYIPREYIPTEGIGSIFQSYLLFSAVGLLATLYIFRDAIAEPENGALSNRLGDILFSLFRPTPSWYATEDRGRNPAVLRRSYEWDRA